MEHKTSQQSRISDYEQIFIFRINPINLLLSGIALADMLLMVEYVPFSVHMYLLNTRNKEEKVWREILT